MSEANTQLQSENVQTLSDEEKVRIAEAITDPVLFAKVFLQTECWHTQADILRELTKPFCKVAVKACHSSSKCVPSFEYITLGDGSRVRARDLVGKKFLIPTLTSTGTVVLAQAQAEFNSFEEVFTITTDTGKKITRNKHHPLWRGHRVPYKSDNPMTPAEAGRLAWRGKKSDLRGVIVQDGWTEFSQFKLGELVAVTDSLPVFGLAEVDLNEVKVIGYLIGDGSLSGDGVGFTQQDNKQLAEFRQCVETLGAQVVPSWSDKAHTIWDGVSYNIVGSSDKKVKSPANSPSGVVFHRVNPITNLVRSYGLDGKRSEQKFVPDKIFSLTKPLVASFLSRLYSTDGWASTYKDESSSIGYSSVSEQLIRDIADLLLRFGINGVISCLDSSYKNKEGEVVQCQPSWEITISGCDQVVKFCDEIGIYGKEEAVQKARNTAFLKSQVKLPKEFTIGKAKTKVLTKFGQGTGRAWRKKNAPPGTFWEKVTKVESRGIEPTIAIEVPNYGTYLTSFWEHNTHTAALALLWFLARYTEAIVVTTGPTWNQVKKITWGEVHSALARSRYPFPEANQVELNFISKGFPKRYAQGHATTVTKEDEGVKFQGYHACLSEEHEILTRRGWVNIDGIDPSDLVLSVPANGRAAEWMPVTGIHKYPFDGNLTVYDGRVVSFAVTDEHKFVTKYDNIDKKPWKLDSISNLSKKYQWNLRRVSFWKGTDLVVPQCFAKYGWGARKFAEFVGFWTGDGGLREHSLGLFYEVLCYQTKEDNGYLDNLLEGIRLSKKYDYRCFSDKECAHWLLENVGRYSPHRVIPRIILDASSDILEAYAQGLWHADGNVKNNKLGTLYSSSSVLMDQVQELLIKLGRPASLHTYYKAGQPYKIGSVEGCVNYDCKEICWNSGSAEGHVVLSQNLKKIKYTGRVWCISTPHQTFYTRRNGKVCISGNSHVLMILDEAPGVDAKIWEAIEGIRAGGDVRILAIGNPTIASGPFFDAFSKNRGSGWKCFTISAFETPNFEGTSLEELVKKGDENVDQISEDTLPYLTRKRWVYERYYEWGPGHPLWESRVLGNFAKQAPDALLSLDWLEKAAIREGKVEGKCRAGLDVAGPGEDETVLTVTCGSTILLQKSWPIPDPRGEVIRELTPFRDRLEVLNVDCIGVGWGIYLHMKDMKLPAIPINICERSSDPELFADCKAEFYWGLRQRFQQGDVCGLIGEEQTLTEETIAQLAGIRWKTNPRGQIEIESKEDAKKRGVKKSPDKAESVMLAYAKRDAVYGVLDLKKQRDMEKVQSSTLIKPGQVDQQLSCPECAATCVAITNGQYRCGNCGHQWFDPRIHRFAVGVGSRKDLVKV